MMREIKYIVLHCTATPQTTTVASIERYWAKNLGWKSPGYHYIIQPDGIIVHLLPIDAVANGVRGYNSVSIHISYIGGVDAKNAPIDNRTPMQIAAQVHLLRELKAKFPDAEIKGHRDFPGVAKACPSFEVSEFIKGINLKITA
jgi:N-acetylmuramoyl-L-alanine amidase